MSTVEHQQSLQQSSTGSGTGCCQWLPGWGSTVLITHQHIIWLHPQSFFVVMTALRHSIVGWCCCHTSALCLVQQKLLLRNGTWQRRPALTSCSLLPLWRYHGLMLPSTFSIARSVDELHNVIVHVIVLRQPHSLTPTPTPYPPPPNIHAYYTVDIVKESFCCVFYM